jgi:hypothetical protein
VIQRRFPRSLFGALAIAVLAPGPTSAVSVAAGHTWAYFEGVPYEIVQENLPDQGAVALLYRNPSLTNFFVGLTEFCYDAPDSSPTFCYGFFDPPVLFAITGSRRCRGVLASFPAGAPAPHFESHLDIENAVRLVLCTLVPTNEVFRIRVMGPVSGSAAPIGRSPGASSKAEGSFIDPAIAGERTSWGSVKAVFH